MHTFVLILCLRVQSAYLWMDGGELTNLKNNSIIKVQSESLITSALVHVHMCVHCIRPMSLSVSVHIIINNKK